MTQDLDDAAIERIALGVLDCTLPKSEWSHAAHFAAALWLLRHRPHVATPAAMRETIRHYNEATDTPNTDEGGYHHTITIASLRAAAAHLAGYPGEIGLSAILAALLTSPLGKPDWLLGYWRRDRLFCRDARHDWREPDIAPLPF
ncbi:hypothetical protein [Sphingomonas lycopersici]|nr:hypothetical protein [Sphingomonas lycopersici]